MKMKQGLMILLSIFLASGCARETYNAEKEYWKAEKILQGVSKTDYEKLGPAAFDPAIQAFQKVAERFPGTSKACDALFVISNLYLKQKKVPEAKKTLETVITNFNHLEKKAAEARYGLAQLYEVENHWPAAEEAYWNLAKNSALEPKGLFSPVHILIHYKKLKDQAGMETAFAKVLDHYESLLKETGPIEYAALIRVHYGTAYMAYGQWEKAREVWLSIDDKDPKSPYAPLSLIAAAELSAQHGEIDKALEAYQKFLEKYPKHFQVERVEVQIGNIEYRKKNYTAAREWFGKVLQRYPENAVERAEVLFLIAQTYQDEGNWEQAEKYYTEIQNQYPKTLSALKVPLKLALHYEASQDTTQAVQELDQAIQSYLKIQQESKDPAEVAYVERLEQVAYAQKGDWNKVLENFDESLQKETIPMRKGSWLLLKAIVTEKKTTDPNKALTLYQSFLEQYPQHPLAALAQRQYQSLLKSNAA